MPKLYLHVLYLLVNKYAPVHMSDGKNLFSIFIINSLSVKKKSSSHIVYIGVHMFKNIIYIERPEKSLSYSTLSFPKTMD
jgi:hypothetical protein